MSNTINNTKINGKPWRTWFASVAQKDTKTGGNKKTISSKDLKIAQKQGEVVKYVPISNRSGGAKIKINNRETVFSNTDFGGLKNFDLNGDNEISETEMRKGLIGVITPKSVDSSTRGRKIRAPRFIARRVIEAAKFALKNGNAHEISWEDLYHGHVLMDLGKPLPDTLSSRAKLRLLHKYARNTRILYHTEELTKRCFSGDKRRNLLQSAKTGKIKTIQGAKNLYGVSPADVAKIYPNIAYMCDVNFEINPKGKYYFSKGQRMDIWLSFIPDYL